MDESVGPVGYASNPKDPRHYCDHGISDVRTVTSLTDFLARLTGATFTRRKALLYRIGQMAHHDEV